MKSKSSFQLTAVFLLGLFAYLLNATAADTNPPPCLTVELRDGSRVVGASVKNYFQFHSALLGEIKLNVKDIRSVECVSSNSAKLSTASGDSLTVAFVDSEFAIKTGFGKVDLQVNSVRRFSVSAKGAQAHPPGLVALWSGEDGGSDSVGSNTATLTDITFAEGKVGRAFSLNGVSSSIRIPASPALDVGAGDGFTITAWIKPAQIDGIHPLFQWSDSVPINCLIGQRPYESGVLMACITDGEGNRFLTTHPNVLVNGVFQHLALTYDKASSLGTWYLNGVIVAQRHLSGQITGTKGDLWFSHIDRSPGNWTTDRAYAGLMDEIAIYSRALSAEEIKSICTAENHDEPLATPATSTGWYESWMR